MKDKKLNFLQELKSKIFKFSLKDKSCKVISMQDVPTYKTLLHSVNSLISPTVLWIFPSILIQTYSGETQRIQFLVIQVKNS